MGLFFGPLGAYFCLDFDYDGGPDQDTKRGMIYDVTQAGTQAGPKRRDSGGLSSVFCSDLSLMKPGH